MIRTYLGGQSV